MQKSIRPQAFVLTNEEVAILKGLVWAKLEEIRAKHPVERERDTTYRDSLCEILEIFQYRGEDK